MSFDPIMPVKIWGVSEGPQPSWPCNRTFVEVDTLHEWNNNESLQNGNLANTGNLQHTAPQGGVIADLGCGDGTFAARFKELRPDVQVIAAGSHDLLPANIEKIDQVFYGYIPQQQKLLEQHTGKCDGIFETYGPTTYYKNPVHVVNYALLLGAPGATYSCISSTVNSGTPKSVFGSHSHFHTVIKKFFDEKFGSRLALIDTKIKSRVHEGVILDDFLLRMRLKGHNFVGTIDYETLCQAADDEIGVPSTIEREWFVADKQYKIEEKIWPKDPQAPALDPDNIEP